MKALVVYCHPHGNSFNAGILKSVQDTLIAAGADIQTLDLYADGFQPGLSEAEFTTYLNPQIDCPLLTRYIEAVKWCDALFFVYPTWWYGVPAILKGWLDRVLIPGVAFHMPDGGDIQPGLTHVTSLGVFTTCGASRKLTWLVGAPGKRTLLRGIRLICNPKCKTVFAAHYSMDDSTPQSRQKHIATVETKLARFVKSRSSKALQTAQAASA